MNALKEEMLDQVATIDTVLKYSEEELITFCLDKDLGYVMGLKNLLQILFNRMLSVKEDLVDLLIKEPSNDEAIKVLNGVYSEMFKLEQKSFILGEIISQRQIVQ